MKTKVTDLRAAYPELSPDKDYPPLKFKSLSNPFGLTYDARRLADRLDPSYRN